MRGWRVDEGVERGERDGGGVVEEGWGRGDGR